MAKSKFSTIVEITCKTLWKSPWKSPEKLCENLLFLASPYVKPHFPTNFSRLSHRLSHNLPSLELPKLFHYSTAPTITTTNIIYRKELI